MQKRKINNNTYRTKHDQICNGGGESLSAHHSTIYSTIVMPCNENAFVKSKMTPRQSCKERTDSGTVMMMSTKTNWWL